MAVERGTITQMIQQLQPNTALIPFKTLSTIIDKANSMLPEKVIAILQELSASYSITKTIIEVGFTSSSDLLSEFVIKSWKVMESGMNKDDQKSLMTLGNELNIVFIDKLEAFVESSRSELVEIHSQLLVEATGGKIQNLLDKRKELENNVLQLSTELRIKASECSINQGIIDLLQLAALLTKIGSAVSNNQAVTNTIEAIKTFSTGFSVDLVTAKDDVQSGAMNIKEQLGNCKSKIQEFYDQVPETKKSFSRFTQKFRAMNVGDLVTSARKNLDKLMERTTHQEETNATSESNTSQAIMDSLKQGKEILSQVTEGWEKVKDEIKTVITKLNGQINDYKTKTKEYCDNKLEEQGSLWIFSWKVRDIYVGNGRKILEENINRLIERTSFLTDVFQNGSIVDFVKTVYNGKEPLSSYEEKQIQLEQKHKQLQERYDQVAQEFHAVIQEINEICQSSGTSNLESIKMVDELCRAVQSGEQSIVSAYTIMRVHLSAINADQDLLADSVLDALQVLNMIDGYIDTRKINDIKQVLALE